MQEKIPHGHSENLHQTDHGLYISDLVYGSNDGIITTFAVVSGAAGAALTTETIIILGLASLVADGISMGISNYLAISSRLDYQKQERRREEFEVDNFPEKERSEVREILERWGIPERYMEETLTSITSDKTRWVDLMMKEELGIFEDKIESPSKHGLVTMGAFVIAGSLPLTPYLFGVNADSQFIVSIIATASSLFVVGSARTYLTGAKWFQSGLQMLLVGSAAAASAYLVGALVKNFFGIMI
ncbi:MAG: VIT1/CCC1 transporter family protein [bacterium]|nr:VIT1/CCC1 transporter family protein [bacterium]